MALLECKLGLIGGGVMGEALLSRLIIGEIYQPQELIVSEVQETRRHYLAETYGVQVTADNQTLARSTPAILLAIKPQIFAEVASKLNQTLITNPSKPLIISILAGVKLSQLESAFEQLPVIRAMPNTPATIGAGITALAMGSQAKDSDRQVARKLFESVGEVVEVSETLMDAVTGLSGSGPAYVAIIVEALADGGVKSGLPRNIAMQLALATLKGTVELLQTTEMHPAELKDRVTSPGGTTIAGVAQLERLGLRSALIQAVQAATERSQELGK
ncbi:MAG: pyrroline-5-carboxylate reductase [Chroococcus sp. CMT-3BRIN-NPC107]|nr:pyrroline-5-carboxylate reductase [Chroococcus sp. CMT-3BRIN-NPC107]